MKISISLLSVAIAVALLAASCKPVSISGEHLPFKTMQSILLDINIAEVYSQQQKDSLHRPGTKNMDSLSVYYKDIFAHYHITQAQFDKSLDWYKNNPDELDSIYSNNVQTATKWEASFFKKVPPRPVVHAAIKDTAVHKDTLAARRVFSRPKAIVK